MRGALPLVAVGGVIGAEARWALGLLPGNAGFPWTTLAINVSGCAALALLLTSGYVAARPAVGHLLGPGVLGGYTTLSTYAEETRALLADGEPALGLAYLLVTAAGCLGAVAVVQRSRRPEVPR